MSTEYYRVCEKCLAGVTHFHARSDTPVVVAFFGGTARGMQLDIDSTLTNGEDDSTMLISEYGVAEVGVFPTSLGALKKNIGLGKLT